MQANSLVLGGIVIGLVVAAFGDQGTIRELPVGKYLSLGLTVMPSCLRRPDSAPRNIVFSDLSHGVNGHLSLCKRGFLESLHHKHRKFVTT